MSYSLTHISEVGFRRSIKIENKINQANYEAYQLMYPILKELQETHRRVFLLGSENSKFLNDATVLNLRQLESVQVTGKPDFFKVEHKIEAKYNEHVYLSSRGHIQEGKRAYYGEYDRRIGSREKHGHIFTEIKPTPETMDLIDVEKEWSNIEEAGKLINSVDKIKGASCPKAYELIRVMLEKC